MCVTIGARPSTRSSAFAILAFAVAGCAGGEGPDAGVLVRDSAGITIVENDYTQPRWTTESAWHLTEEPVTRIGAVEGQPEQQLYQAFSSRRLRDGRIAVVNTSSREVRIYDASGQWLSTVGRDGEGPGEFRYAWEAYDMPGDSLMVVDLGRHISVFDERHEFVRRFLPERLDSIPMGEGFEPIGQFADGSLLFRSHIRGGEPVIENGIRRNQINLVRIGTDGAIESVLGPYHDQSGATEAGVPYLFGAWAKEAPADSTVWYGPGNVFDIREIAGDGRVVRIIRLDRPSPEVTQALVDEYIESIARQNPASRQIINRRYRDAQYPAAFPAHFEIMVDDEANLWVQDYRPFSDRVERTWSVFDPAGRFLGDVRMPAGFDVHHIGGDFVLGRWLDDLEVEYIVMYGLEKPHG